MPFNYRGLPSTLSSFYGFIKYTVEIFTIDDDQYESRGEREIILMAPIDADLEVSTLLSSSLIELNYLPDAG